MSDIQALQASVGADVAQFLAAMQQAAASVQALAASQVAAQAAARQLSEAEQAAAQAAAAQAAADRAAAQAAREKAAADAAAAQAAAQAAQQRKEGLQAIAVGAAAVSYAMERMGSTIIDAGLELSNTISETKNAFGESSGAVMEWAEAMAKTTGHATDDIEKVASAMQFMVRGMGLSKEQSTEMAKGFATVAVELEKVRHISLDEAQQALAMALEGRAQGLKRLGIIITPVMQNEAALAAGYKQSFQQLSQTTQAQLNYNLVLQQAAGLDKQAAAAMDDPSNKLAAMNAHLHDLWETLGTRLMPAFLDVVGVIDQAAQWFNTVNPAIQTAVVYIGAAVGVAAALTSAFAGLALAMPAIESGLALMGTALEAIGIAGAVDLLPIIAIIAAVAAAIAAWIVIVGAVRRAWDADLGGIREKVAWVRDQLEQQFEAIKTVWHTVEDAFSKSIDYLEGIFSDWKNGVLDQIEAVLRGVASVADNLPGGDKYAAMANDAIAALERAKSATASDVGAAVKAGAAKAAELAKDAGHQVAESFKAGVQTLGLDKLLDGAKAAVAGLFPTTPGKTAVTGDRTAPGAAAKYLQEAQHVAELNLKLSELANAEAHDAAQAQIKAAQEAYKLQHEAAADAQKSADEQYSAAKSALEEAQKSGGLGDIASARAAMDQAYDQVQRSTAAVAAMDQQHLVALNAQLKQQQGAQDAAFSKSAAADMQAAQDVAAYQQSVANHASDDAIATAKGQADLSVQAAQKAHEEYKQATSDLVGTQGDIAASQKDLDNQHLKAWKDAADYHLEKVKEAAAAQKAWTDLGKQALSSFGGSTLGGVISGAGSMAVAGGGGMIAGAVVALAEASTQGKALADSVNGLMQNAADAVGQMLAPLVPVVNGISAALKPVLAAVGDFFGAIGRDLGNELSMAIPVIRGLAPSLKDLAESLAQVVDVIAQINLDFEQLAVATHILDIAVRFIGSQINSVAATLKYVAEGFADMWNGVLTVLIEVFEKLGHILPGSLGDIASDFAGDLGKMAVDVHGFDGGVVAATNSLGGMTAAAQAAADAMSQAGQIAKQRVDEQEQYRTYQQALADAQASGAPQSVIDSLTKSMNDAKEKVAADEYRQSAYVARAAGDMTTFYEDMAQAAILDAKATTANTKAINDLNSTLTNAPSGFKLAMYEGVAAGAGISPQPVAGANAGATGGVLGKRVTGAGTTNVNGNINITIVTSDPKTAGQAVVDKLREHNFKQSGSLTAHSGGLFGS